MLNLLLALALTSSISGNDIDIPTPLNTQVETTVDDSTNSDIVSAINETNELLETILAPQTVNVSYTVSELPYLSSSICSVNGSVISYENWNVYYFAIPTSNCTCILNLSDITNSRIAYSNEIPTIGSTIYECSMNFSSEVSLNTDYSYVYISARKPFTIDVSYSYQQTYSFSDIGDRLVAQERQLDNITFVVIVLLLLPIIKGITNKLTHRKENS